ncbi:IclR family transcriptional regulator domain-containing protein [Burkholderia sp. WSM2232]|uniref:IclR family transcriptional regulator domain-containing protein n=1 Tax=Burkholderia sp. WSM2232 TaxID=944436 RepID=UPI0004291F20|nr:IclR family transcriptional regulator C-terminal domain-containing protein [Burkholderia sp. WSM2232]
MMEFGYRYQSTDALIERANPYLLELNRRSGETVDLAEPHSLDMVSVARVTSPTHTVVHMPIGRRLPIYCTASGRAYLSTLDIDEARALLETSHRVNVRPVHDYERRRDIAASGSGTRARIRERL